MSLPDEFELPLPSDFCRGIFDKGKKHCFMGWQRKLLPMAFIWVTSSDEERGELSRFIRVAMGTALKMNLHHRTAEGIPGTCFHYNDDTRNTTTQLAKWFEETVKEFGYDVE